MLQLLPPFQCLNLLVGFQSPNLPGHPEWLPSGSFATSNLDEDALRSGGVVGAEIVEN